MKRIGELTRGDLGRINEGGESYLLTALCASGRNDGLTVDVKLWIFQRDDGWTVVAREGHRTSGEAKGLDSAEAAERFGIDAINRCAPKAMWAWSAELGCFVVRIQVVELRAYPDGRWWVWEAEQSKADGRAGNVREAMLAAITRERQDTRYRSDSPPELDAELARLEGRLAPLVARDALGEGLPDALAAERASFSKRANQAADLLDAAGARIGELTAERDLAQVMIDELQSDLARVARERNEAREALAAEREAIARIAEARAQAARALRATFCEDDRGYRIADAAVDECEEIAAAIRERAVHGLQYGCNPLQDGE